MIGPSVSRVDEPTSRDAATSTGEGSADAGGRFAAWRRKLAALTPRRIVSGVVALAAVIALAIWGHTIDLEGFHTWTKELPASGVIALIALLPVMGFPVSVLHLAAGLRFDFWGAMLIVGGTTLVHHVLSWALVRALPARCFTRLEPWRKRLVGAGHREAAVVCSLIPGMPYGVQLYLLPVMGVPVRVLCFISVPLHTLRATVTILLGNLSDDLTVGRVAGLIAYYLVLVGACGLALRGLRRLLKENRDAT